MSIPNTGKRTRRPTHPGEMLREEYLPDYGLTVAGLADAIHVSRQTVNELVNERRALSPEMAMRLARLFGGDATSWLNLQRAVDLFDAEKALRDELATIKPLETPDEAA
jgi:antitoxin HigA-1